MSGNVFIVAAPSGAGKTSLVKALVARDPDVTESVSYTTRVPRPGEHNNRDYHFVDQETFEKMSNNGDFLESAMVHGNYYATGKEWIHSQCAAGHDIVLEIDWQGAQQVRKLLPHAVGIFVLPPSVDVLRKRLIERAQDSATVIDQRIATARSELSHVNEFDYVIINDDFDDAIQDLISIVRSTRLRVAAQLSRNESLINSLK